MGFSIEINTCRDCPYGQHYYMDNVEVHVDTWKCQIKKGFPQSHDDGFYSIPDWCPMTNMKTTKIKTEEKNK